MPSEAVTRRRVWRPHPAADGSTIAVLDAAGLVLHVLKFNEYGEFAGLLYYWTYSVPIPERAVPEVLQLFKAHKFLDHESDLVDCIRKWERLESISADLAELTRRDWATSRSSQ